MSNADVLARVSALASLMAAMFNLFVAGLFFLSMFLFLVGFLWLPVALFAGLEAVGAVVVLVSGHTRFGFLLPIVGIGCSLVNFNFLGCVIEILAFALAIGAMFVQPAAPPEA